MKYSSFGQRIRDTRVELGLRQEDVAQAAGVTVAAVSSWERDETKNMKPPHLFAVADLFKVNARWLALEQGPRFMKAAMLALFAAPLLAGLLFRGAACVLCKIIPPPKITEIPT